MDGVIADFLAGMGGPGIIILVLLGVIAALWRRLLHVQDRELTDSRSALSETANALRENARSIDALTVYVRAGGRREE